MTDARKMTREEWLAGRAAMLKPQPRQVREIAGGRHVRDMTDHEYQRALADFGMRRDGFMKGTAQ